MEWILDRRLNLIDFIYFKYLVEIVLGKSEIIDPLLEEKITMLKYFYSYANEFKKKKINTSLIMDFFEKKSNMVVNANTKKELDEIKKKSIPVYDMEKGKLISSGRFHSEEEELILWSIFTSTCKPNQLGYERYCELFKKLYKTVCD